MNKITTILGLGLATAFLLGLSTTLTRSSMIGFWDILPVYILMIIAIGMMYTSECLNPPPPWNTKSCTWENRIFL